MTGGTRERIMRRGTGTSDQGRPIKFTGSRCAPRGAAVPSFHEPLGRIHPQLLAEAPPLVGPPPCAYRMQSAYRRDHGPSAPADTTL